MKTLLPCKRCQTKLEKAFTFPQDMIDVDMYRDVVVNSLIEIRDEGKEVSHFFFPFKMQVRF